MDAATKIANLLLSNKQVNKDLAFGFIKSQNVNFSLVLCRLRSMFINNHKDILGDKAMYKFDIFGIKLVIHRLRSDSKDIVFSVWRLSKVSGGNKFYDMVRNGYNTIHKSITNIDYFISIVSDKYYKQKQQ